MATTEPTLQQQLDAVKANTAKKASAIMHSLIENQIAQLAQSGIAEKSLPVGAKVPDFVLPDALGKMVMLSSLLMQGPVVVAFYRGEWCPYCNLQLRAYQQILPQIKELGASLVAISPQVPDHSLSMVEKDALAFPVLSDSDNRVARQYGLVFAFTEEQRASFKGRGLDLSTYNGNEAWALPVPGVFLLDQSGIVRVRFVDVDFRKRMEPSTLLAHLHDMVNNK